MSARTIGRLSGLAFVMLMVMGSATTANADTGPAGINYSAQAIGDSVVLAIDSGSFDTADDRLEIRDDSGNLRFAYPLGYYRPGSCAPYLLDPFPFSIRAAAFETGAVLGGVFLIP